MDNQNTSTPSWTYSTALDLVLLHWKSHMLYSYTTNVFCITDAFLMEKGPHAK